MSKSSKNKFINQLRVQKSAYSPSPFTWKEKQNGLPKEKILPMGFNKHAREKSPTKETTEEVKAFKKEIRKPTR